MLIQHVGKLLGTVAARLGLGPNANERNEYETLSARFWTTTRLSGYKHNQTALLRFDVVSTAHPDAVFCAVC